MYCTVKVKMLKYPQKSLQSKLLDISISVPCTDVDIATAKAKIPLEFCCTASPYRRVYAAFVFKYLKKSLPGRI